MGTGESGVDRRKGTCPVHVATTGSTQMEMAPLENFGAFSCIFFNHPAFVWTVLPLPVPLILVAQIIRMGE